MKLSLSWLFSHIKKNPFLEFQSEFEKGNFFERIGSTVAEVEHVEKIIYPLDKIFLAKVTHQDTSCTLRIPEINKDLVLPHRPDLVAGDSCLVIKKEDTYAYLTLRDLYAQKEGLVPAVWVPDSQKQGVWKKNLPPCDYILTFDNKALTHRPDLWGHRGFAREVAALYGLEMVPDEHIFAQKAIRAFSTMAPAVPGNTIGLENLDSHCNRIAGLSIPTITCVASFPDMLFRLCAIDAKPINGVVDTTNYVMFDIGQPMHAFDAAHLVDVLRIRPAQAGEKLVLLDSTVITLAAGDMVTSDTEKVLSLAGLMGGKDSGVTRKTSGLFIESGSYAATAIRKMSLTYKVRTESSTRYEKSLDPLYNTQAITRFLHLLDIHDVPYTSAQAIMSLGQVPQEKIISFTQALLAERIGTPISVDTIHTVLSALGFGVQQKETLNGSEFIVSVPSFRATKDITQPEDIVEEIARFIGFNNLPMQLPSRVMKPFSTAYITLRRALKRLCAFGFSMHEVSNYACYDNQFLHAAGMVDLLSDSVYSLANPVSENWTHLVSSLIPHLFKNIEQNIHQHNRMAFFEMNTIWKKVDNQSSERTSFAGVWYQIEGLAEGLTGAHHFYTCKRYVDELFNLVGVQILWRKPLMPLAPWYHPYMTAELVYNSTIIGYAGCVQGHLMSSLSAGNAFVFEIDLDLLLAIPQEPRFFTPLVLYQPVTTDISLLVPFTISVDALEQAIAHVDARIYLVQLVDYFEKAEWVDKRSVTMRYKTVDQEKTFSKQEIENVRNAVVDAVKALGVEVR